MDDILAKKNRHLFLEEKDNQNNSFIGNINDVANRKTELDTVAAHIENVDTVGDHIDNVDTVANNISDINDAVDNIATVKTFNDNVNNGTMQYLLEAFTTSLNEQGNAWEVRLTQLGESILATTSAFNYSTVVTVSNDIPANGTLILPNSMKYKVGTHMLMVSWNGTVCYAGDQYDEVGAYGVWATSIKLNQSAKAGDKIQLRIVALTDQSSYVDITEAAINASQFVASGSNTERYLPEFLGDVVNVKNFGAVGNGVNDDTTAFQSAIASGKAVFVPEGTYKLNTDLNGVFCGVGNSIFTGGTVNGMTILRGIAQRNSDIINVKDFGAKGDGTTDDTVAFNSVPDYVPVYVPAGTYRISNPYDLGENKRFFGLGKLVFDNAEHRRRGGSSGSTEVPEHYTLFYNYDSQSDVTVTFDDVEQTITWVDDFTVEAPGSASTVDVRINIANGWINLGSIPEGVRGFNVFAFGGKHSVITDEPSTPGSGYNNVSIGSRAMEHVTSGSNNVAIGSRALLSDETGQNNTAIGFQALYRASGHGNTAVGSIAGEWVTTGEGNTLVGEAAGAWLTAGDNNACVGLMAGKGITTGSYNVAVGYRAHGNSTNPSDDATECVSVGAFAGDLSAGKSNTWVGYRAGASGVNAQGTETGISLGHDNVAIGKFAMRYQYGANCNVCVGTGSGLGLSNGKNNVMIGFEAGTNSNASYDVLIGYQAGGVTSGGGNVFIGFNVARKVTSGNNVVIGNSAAPNLTSGEKNVILGANAGRLHIDQTLIETDTQCVFLGYDTRNTGSNQVQLGNSGQTCYAFGSVQDRSDERDKADIRDTTLGLDFILALRPVDFKWDYRDDYLETLEDGSVVAHEKDGSKKRNRFHHGLIAQEVKTILDNKGIDFGGYQDHKINGGCDVLTLGYEEFVAPLIKAIQELNAQSQILNAKIEALMQRISALENNH